MWGDVRCTASQFMTPTVITVEQQTTIGQLGALQHDFNTFPVTEDALLPLFRPQTARLPQGCTHR